MSATQTFDEALSTPPPATSADSSASTSTSLSVSDSAQTSKIARKRKADETNGGARCILKFVKQGRECVIPPFRATAGAAGYELSSAYPYKVKPGEVVRVDTGLRIQLPKNTYGRIASKSSLAINNIHVVGGVIDEDYRGNVFVLLLNLNPDKDMDIFPGTRIAQLICEKIVHPRPIQVLDLDATARGNAGFGSTTNDEQ